MPLARLTARKMSPGRNLLRGTVPVPDDWAGGPLHVVDSHGASWPTSVETVVRGPSGKPRVLYLTAVGDTPGGLQRFTVEPGFEPVYDQHPAPPTVRIVSEDHRGVAYSASIRPTSLLTNNTVAHTQRHAGELTAGAERFIGYEAFLTTIAGQPDVVLLDMAALNGRVDSGAEILHHLFFRTLGLEAPAGWSVAHAFGNPLVSGATLIGADPAGTMHVLPQGQPKEFRLALYRNGAIARANRLLDYTGFFTCDSSLAEWSWSNPATAWFTPMAAPMPSLSKPGYLPYGASCGAIEMAMATGQPLSAANMLTPCGPFYPRGTTYGGVTGGTGIQAFQGMDVLVSDKPNEALRVLMAMQSMDADRSDGICLLGSDQAAVDCAHYDLSGLQYVTHGKLDKNHEGPWKRSLANQWRYQEVAAAGKLPSYWNALTVFEPYDFAHLIRALGPSVGLAWLVNDPIAKSRIASMAAWSRAYLLEYGHGAVAQAFVQGVAHPGKGGTGGREHGWAGEAIMADLWLANDKKRAGAAAWIKTTVDMLAACQLPSGGWQAAMPGEKPANTVNAFMPAGSEPLAAAQAIEFGIFLNLVRALYVWTGDTRLATLLAKAAKGCRDFHWKLGSGPHETLAVRWADINKPAFVVRSDAPHAAATANTDTYQTWLVALYAALANPKDENALWILQALGVTTPEALAAKMPEKLQEGAGAVLAWLQAQGGVVTPPPDDPPRTDPPPRTDISIRLRSIRWTRALWERFQRAIGGRN